MSSNLINANPVVYATAPAASAPLPSLNDTALCFGDEATREPLTAEEVFALIRHLRDPEHPLTLEQLRVVTLDGVEVDEASGRLDVTFTPTVPHCSMATLIGLCIRVKLLRSLPRRLKLRIIVAPGAHASEVEVNRQLNDKERVAAALENAHLLRVVTTCIADTDPKG